MTMHDRLAGWIEAETEALQRNLPANLELAVHELLVASQSSSNMVGRRTVTGVPVAQPGLGLALRLLLQNGGGAEEDERSESWSGEFLAACDAVADAQMVMWHYESGFMRLQERSEESLDAWIATRRAPARWRELAAYTRWAAWNNGLAEVERPSDSTAFFSYQFGYPAESTLFGTKAGEWAKLVGRLFELAESADAEPVTVTESGLVGFLAERLKGKPDVVAERLPFLILDRDNAQWHEAPPAIAAAPIVRVSEEKLVISPHGVWMAPLLFLTREMRRRDAAIYHNAAQGKEDLFRRELYALFPESRFVTARNRVLLRRPEGEARTDIDAAIFDKKTGTLAIFELKALDPFARSTAELNRQRDNTLDAGHQISAILDWINRNGADEILKRIDSGAAKKFKVQRVLPFVLGRCLVRFDDGPAPEARAAWSDWPSFVQHVEAIAATNATNPLQSLHARISQELLPEIDVAAFSPHVIELQSTRRRIEVMPVRPIVEN